MTSPRVVANASPLIALRQIDRLDLLNAIFPIVTIPPAVASETRPSLSVRPVWIVEHPLVSAIPPRLWHAPIDPGEREVIALALELDGEWVILDDLAARKLASDRGLLVVGTVGVLIRAKQRGLLPAIRPSLDALVDVGFFIGSRLYHRVLTDTGEAV